MRLQRSSILSSLLLLALSGLTSAQDFSYLDTCLPTGIESFDKEGDSITCLDNSYYAYLACDTVTEFEGFHPFRELNVTVSMNVLPAEYLRQMSTTDRQIIKTHVAARFRQALNPESNNPRTRYPDSIGQQGSNVEVVLHTATCPKDQATADDFTNSAVYKGPSADNVEISIGLNDITDTIVGNADWNYPIDISKARSVVVGEQDADGPPNAGCCNLRLVTSETRNIDVDAIPDTLDMPDSGSQSQISSPSKAGSAMSEDNDSGDGALTKGEAGGLAVGVLVAGAVLGAGAFLLVSKLRKPQHKQLDEEGHNHV